MFNNYLHPAYPTKTKSPNPIMQQKNIARQPFVSSCVYAGGIGVLFIGCCKLLVRLFQ